MIRGVCVRYLLLVFCITSALAVSSAARAEEESPQLVEQIFVKFAQDWLGDLAREAPRGGGVRFLAPGAPGQPEQFTYRDYGEDFAVQMRQTGDAESPFVGILSYTENVYVCRGPTRDDCELVESSPITEIFPFRNGSWQY